MRKILIVSVIFLVLMVGCSPSPSPPPTPTPSLEPSITTPIVTPTPNIQPTYGNYCASKNSDFFHHCLCIYVHNILAENLIRFNTRNQALATGRRPCSVCKP
ncbi:MAG: hypothetical protein QM279_09425 [Atribacterota bacterium]|nr:hypothetical protein [Atribacterota bacterium]HHT11182.1 hypothetical protein [Candidatus Atribacteria bacterium]